MTIILIIISLMLTACGSGIGKQTEPAGTPTPDTVQTSAAGPPEISAFEPAEGVAVFAADEGTLAKAGHKIAIYGADGEVLKRIDARDDSLGSLGGEEGDFFPLLFSNGASRDFAIELRITGRSENWIRVVVHETREPKTMGYLKADDPMFKKLSWEDWVLAHFNIRFDAVKNPVLDQPDGSPKAVSIPDEPLIKADEVKGDWVLIRWMEHEPMEPTAEWLRENKPENAGWIRWRKDGEIVIEEFFP